MGVILRSLMRYPLHQIFNRNTLYTVERVCLKLKVIDSQAEMCLHYGIKFFRWVLSVYRMTEFCALLSAVLIKFSFSLKTKAPSRFISVENILKVQLYFYWYWKSSGMVKVRKNASVLFHLCMDLFIWILKGKITPR